MIGSAFLLAAAVALCTATGVGTQEQVAFANLYLVNTTSDTVVLGACQNGDAGCSLRGAIQTANAHAGADGIVFDLPAGSVINLTAALPDLTDSVNINGPGADKLTVRDNASTSFSIFKVTGSAAVSVSGITINNGNNGITVSTTSTVNVTKCTINGNADGGIVHNSTGTLNVTSCGITGNGAVGGAGIYNTGPLNVTNTTIAGNVSTGVPSGGAGQPGLGGGILNSGTLNVTNSTLSANSATGGFAPASTGGPGVGGGIYNTGTATIINSTLSGNSAVGGSGAAQGAGDGGGIYSSATLNVTNSTIAGNTTGGSSTAGGGIWNFSGSLANVKSTIIAVNTATSGPDASGPFTTAGFNLVGKNNGSTGFTAANDLTGTTVSPLVPKLGPLQDNGGPTYTLALLSGSPAIDKGTSNGLTGTLTTDQRGVGYKRTIDKSVANATGGDGTDIGAFELGAKIKAVSSKTHGTAGIFTINLPLFGPKLGVECRNGGASGVFKVILTFPSAVTVSAASVTPDPAAPGATASVSSFNVSGSKVTVNLTGVSNAQTILVNLSGVSNGSVTNDVSVPMGVLLGDATGDGSVTSNGDVSLTQSKVGQAVTKSTCREDVTVDGSINSTDVQTVQSKVGTHLP